MKSRAFALVDCNNFYASCERVFSPTLKNKPVVVLSNNDGCIVARSSESKALGIPMGAPMFKWKDFLEENKVAVLSSNYRLYGEMSSRVMEILGQFTPKLEIYSIDEAFLDLSHIPKNKLEEHGRKIVETIQQWTGIPVSIGIAPTKTLAKAGNYLAKKTPTSQGVVSLMNNPEEVLMHTPVEEIWGIGRNLAPKLHGMGIKTAAQLAAADPKLIRKKLTISGAYLQAELNGYPSLGLEDEPTHPKSVICSRSFKHPKTELWEVSEALSSFIEHGAEKLRESAAIAKYMTVYIATNRFNPDEYYAKSFQLVLPVATNNTAKLLPLGLEALEKIFIPGKGYKKAGVAFGGILEAGSEQTTLFGDEDKPKDTELMKIIDSLNRHDRQITFASSGNKDWGVGAGRSHVSPEYLTDWNQILKVKA